MNPVQRNGLLSHDELWSRLRVADDRAPQRLLDGLYDLALILAQVGVIDAWRASQQLPDRTNARMKPSVWSSYRDEFMALLENSPDLVAAWPALDRLIDRFEADPGRQRLWKAFKAFWYGEPPPLDSLEKLAPSLDRFGLYVLSDLCRKAHGSVKSLPFLEGALMPIGDGDVVPLDEPLLVRGHFRLASINSALGQPRQGEVGNYRFLAKAVEHGRIAVSIDPASGWAHTNLGKFLVDLVIWRNAIAASLLGSIRESNAFTTVSVSCLGPVFPLPTPAFPSILPVARERQRMLDLGAEEKDLAALHYERAISLTPGSTYAYSNLANLISSTDPDRSRELFRTVLQMEPCEEACMQSYFNFLTQYKEYEEAREMLAEFNVSCPDSGLGYLFLGKLMYWEGADAQGAGDLDSARTCFIQSIAAFETYLEKAPNHREAADIRSQLPVIEEMAAAAASSPK